MITADKHAAFERLLAWYFRRRVRRSFAAVHVRGLGALRASLAELRAAHPVPLVLYANHPGWWDAVLPFLVSVDELGLDAYGMMEEPQLARYRFFRRIGMFSVDRERPREAMRSLSYAAELLRGRNRALWVFPQGELVSADLVPLRFQSGTAHLLRMLGDVAAAPVAIRYEFVADERAEAFLSVGPVWHITPGERVDITITTRMLESLLEDEMAVQREAVRCRELASYEQLYRGHRSINARWDSLRGK